MSEDRLGETGGGEVGLLRGGGGEHIKGGGEHINKKQEEFSLDRLELLKTVGTGECLFFNNVVFSPRNLLETGFKYFHTVDPIQTSIYVSVFSFDLAT